jgi:hypothetical protein
LLLQHKQGVTLRWRANVVPLLTAMLYNHADKQ